MLFAPLNVTVVNCMVLVIKNKDSVLKKKNLFFYYNFFKHQKKNEYNNRLRNQY